MLVIKPGFEVSKMRFGYKHDKKKEKKTERKRIVNLCQNIMKEKQRDDKGSLFIETKAHLSR